MKMLININACVEKNNFSDKQLWQILSGNINLVYILLNKILYLKKKNILGIVFPVLIWRPGKTAESLRAAACLCAQIIINKYSCFNDIILNQVSRV